MQLIDIVDSGTDFDYQWPTVVQRFHYWVEYHARAGDGEHRIRIGFGSRKVYDRERKRVVAWIDGQPHAEFMGADDYEASGDILSEIKIPGDVGERICRYPSEPVPERYSGLPVVGLKTRVTAKRVHNAWAVVANIGDHRTVCALAALRRIERRR